MNASRRLVPNWSPSLVSLHSASHLYASGTIAVDIDENIESCKDILRRAAETKTEDPEVVLKALEDLEQLMRYVYTKKVPIILLCFCLYSNVHHPNKIDAVFYLFYGPSRQKRKAEGESVTKDLLKKLTGDWRLIFTTGTKNTQDRFKTRINYFPLKAVQSFDATEIPFKIENGIYFGTVPFLKFFGEFDFDVRKSKVKRCFRASCSLPSSICTGLSS